MLTPDQIKKLKKGDKLLVDAYFVREKDGYHIKCSLTPPYAYKSSLFSIIPSCVSLPSEHRTLVPTPKYDPCRLLRKGDRVQVKKRNGRCNGKDGEYLREAFCEVAEDEVPNELVRVFHNSSEYRLDPAYLELVTPVEEIEPYKLIDSPKTYNIVRDSAMVMTIHKKSHPNAKAAAEAELDRLNDEWRKEQK